MFGLAGAAVLLDYSTYDSQIQPIIRKSMTSLIVNSQHEDAAQILRMVQENVKIFIFLAFQTGTHPNTLSTLYTEAPPVFRAFQSGTHTPQLKDGSNLSDDRRIFFSAKF